jgi:hypothetical protein
MTVKAIDLGLFDGLFMQLNGVTFDDPSQDSWFLDWHSRIKTALEGELGHTSGIAGDNWAVDRLFYWIPGTTDRGYGFVIKRLDGTVSALETGEQWLLWAGGLEALNGASEGVSIWGGSNVEFYRLHRNWNDVIQSSAPASGLWGLHYHTGGIGDQASSVLTFVGQPADTQNVIVNGKTYVFQTTLTDSDGNVQIGATLAESIDNLCRAINLGAGAGLRYAASTTAHTTVECTGITGTTLTATALLNGTVGNAYTVTTTVTGATWSPAGTMGGGGANLQTYAVGGGVDLDPPTVSPHLAHVDGSGFFPDFTVRPYAKGMVMDSITMFGASTSFFYGHVFAALWDWEVPYFGILKGTQNYFRGEFLMLAGEVYEPRSITDRYREGCVGLAAQSAGASGGGGSTDADGGHDTSALAGPEGTALDSTGAQVELELHEAHVEFSLANQPRSDGTFDADPVSIYNSTFMKGWVKREVLPIMGHNNSPNGVRSQLHATFEGPNGGYFKIHHQFCMPWPVGTRAKSVLTLSGGNVSDGDQVEVAGKTYTYQTVLTDVDGNVLIGVDEEDSLKNLFNAINLNPAATVRGVKYAAATVPQDLVTGVNAYSRTASTLSVRAHRAGVAGNAITCTDPVDVGGFLSWSPAATLAGGVDGYPLPFTGYPINQQVIPT